MSQAIPYIARGILTIVLLAVLVVGGAVGCSGTTADGDSAKITSTGAAQQDPTADDGAMRAPDKEELEESALAFTRQAYADVFGEDSVDGTDFALAGIAADTDGNWWAHTSATPSPDAMRDPTEYFLELPVGAQTWEIVTQGTDTDASLFPEEVWQEIGYGDGSAQDGGASLPEAVSERSIAYAEGLGGTSHDGEALYLIIGASVESEEEAQAKLDAATPTFGDMQSYFIIQSSDNFQGLAPGWWIVIEAYRADPSPENLDFAKRGFPNAYVKQATVATQDPIPVYEDLVSP